MRENRVQFKDRKASSNYFLSDKLLVDYIFRYVDNDAFTYMGGRWKHLGYLAAGKMNHLSLLADKHGPELNKRDAWGDDVNEVEFHNAYWELMDIAAESEMIRLKWEPVLRKRFAGKRNLLGFISGYIYAMSEMGQYCPLCMTDGTAVLIDKYATEKDKARLMPGFAELDGRKLTTGAMYLTEKSGGSDIGNNLVTAMKRDNQWVLNGEKWFCSNVNADIAMILARTGEPDSRTRGLSVFMMEKYLKNGSRNPIEIIRLKDKLGVRSMASAECLLTDTEGTLLGDENEGLKVMLDMINISRVYNSIAALAGTRRALTEAMEFSINRMAFGKLLCDHPLYREKLWELSALHNANFHLVMRTVLAIDRAEEGDEHESELLRLLTPMAKWWSADTAVYLVRESMELMGGIGYIEDQIMPKLLRDVNVLPIWEGSGNVIILDMLRSVMKTDALKALIKEIEKLELAYVDEPVLKAEAQSILEQYRKIRKLPQEELEVSFKYLAKRTIRLFQIYLMLESVDTGADYLLHSIQYFKNQITGNHTDGLSDVMEIPVEILTGWNFESFE